MIVDNDAFSTEHFTTKQWFDNVPKGMRILSK